MIIRSNEWVTATEIRSDIAIIGSGAAGLSLALALESKNKHLKIVVLEGGDQNFTSTSQEIYRGEFSARDLPYGLQN